MKRTLSIILSLLMVLSLFSGLSISAAETDAADTGAQVALAETGIDVEVYNAAQLKAALEANDGEGTVRNIKVMNDFTQWIGVKGNNGTASYVPTWCTIGSGIKNLMLNGSMLTFENDYAVTTAHPEMSYSELEEVNTLTLFSIPAGAELYVRDSIYTHSGIWYNGQILKDKDGIDNRDIFHVDGGKLVVTHGSFSTEYRTRVYEYSIGTPQRIHRLQVHGTPVTVNSGTAVINGGYFEGRGLNKYLYLAYGLSSDSYAKIRNGAVKFIDGRLIVNGGSFYGDNGAVAINSSRNSNYKLLTFNGGRFAVDTHDSHIGTEKGADCEVFGAVGQRLRLPINGDNYNYWLSYRDGKGNTYSYQDAVDNKIKKLDDDSEVQFYIEPKGTGYTYRFNANGQLLDEAGQLRWANDEPLKISIEPETMSFFGANFKGNSIGQRLTAKMKVTKNNISGEALTENVAVTFSVKGGLWTLDLADYINKNLLSKMSVNNYYSFNFSFTEEQDYSWHNGAKKTYTVKHDGYITMLYKNAEYTLTFDPYGGLGNSFTVTTPKDEAFTLPTCPFGKPNGEEFDCWEILVSETGRLYRQPGETYTPKGNDTIRASWKSVYSTVTLEANNGTGETKELKVLRGGTLKLPPCDFTAPDGTTFYDWKALAQYGGMRYKAGDEITVTKDMTLQAMWEYPPDDIALMTFTITAPEVGAHRDTTCTSLDPDRYIAKSPQWYIVENGRVVEWMSPEDVFEAGKSYAIGINIRVLKGRKTEDTKIYIGGKEAKSIAPSIAEYFSVFTIPAVVDKIEVSLTKPQAGEVPDYNAVVPENEYYERWEYDWTANGSQIYGGVSWYDYTDAKVLAPTDTFIAGHQVKARVYMQTKEPHTFAPQEEMDFGEYSIGGGGFWREDKGNVDYRFTVEGEKYPLWLGTTQVCEENCDDIFGDGRASYDPETYTLTLDYPTIEGYARYEDYFNVDILSQDIDLTVKGGYTMPSEKGGWFGIGAIGGTLTLDGDFTFYGSNAAVWGDNGVYIVGGSLVAEGWWSGISAASSETTVSIGDKVDKVRAAYKQQGYNAITGKLELAENIKLVEADNGYQPGGAYYGYRIYERTGSELETGNFSIDDPLAGMTLPTGDMLFDSDLYLGVTDEDYGYINGVRWHDADDNVLPSDYTPQSGETVYLDIYLKPAGDNVFTEDTVLTVNGKEVACELVYGYLMADNIAFTVGGEAADYLLGDADGDNDVTSVDVTFVQRYCAFMDTGIAEKILMQADIDGNGALEIIDATFIQRWLVRMDIPYTIGEAIS